MGDEYEDLSYDELDRDHDEAYEPEYDDEEYYRDDDYYEGY